jgi:hypothetical protein
MSEYNFALAIPGVGTTGTGTLTVIGTTIAGVGTLFLSELPVGTILHAAGQTLCVASVSDNASAVAVHAASPNIGLGSFTYQAMVNIETLMEAPKPEFNAWAESKVMGDGSARALGAPIATWSWSFMKWMTTYANTHRDALRTFCPTGKSAPVYVRTVQNESADAYVTYSAMMYWPDKEQRDSLRRINFSVEFRNLVAL